MDVQYMSKTTYMHVYNLCCVCVCVYVLIKGHHVCIKASLCLIEKVCTYHYRVQCTSSASKPNYVCRV